MNTRIGRKYHFRTSMLMCLMVALAYFNLHVGWNIGQDVKDHLSRRSNLQESRDIAKLTVHQIGRTSSSEALPKQLLSAHRSKGHMVILTSTNYAYIDFAENWLESLRRCGIKQDVIMVAEDEKSYHYLRRLQKPSSNVALSVWPRFGANAKSGPLKFGSIEYSSLVNKRPGYILGFLEKDTDVLFSDVDTVWLQDPLPLLSDNDFDIQLELDLQGDGQNQPDVLCAGFVYYRASNASRHLLREWIQSINLQPEVPDQMLLNHVLRSPQVRRPLQLGILDHQNFPNGFQFFEEEWRKRLAVNSPVVVHNNWVEGHDVKIERFKQHGLWYLT